MEAHADFWNKNAKRYDRFMRQDAERLVPRFIHRFLKPERGEREEFKPLVAIGKTCVVKSFAVSCVALFHHTVNSSGKSKTVVNRKQNRLGLIERKGDSKTHDLGFRS